MTYAEFLQEAKKSAAAHGVNHPIAFLLKDADGIWGKELTLGALVDLLIAEMVARIATGQLYLFVFRASAEMLELIQEDRASAEMLELIQKERSAAASSGDR